MATRTIFFHISPWLQVAFYLLAALSSGICFYGFYRHFKLWRQGKPAPSTVQLKQRLKDLLAEAMLHRRIKRRSYAGALHAAIFFGMGALFVGTIIVGIEHYGALIFGPHWLYRGWFYAACKVVLDLFGLGLLIGTGLALLRRNSSQKPNSLGNTWKDSGFLILLFAATLTGFVLEGAGLAADPTRASSAIFSPVGHLFSMAESGISPFTYAFVWWVHIPLVLGVIAALPYGRWLHLFVIPLTIIKQPDRVMGELQPASMEEVEKTGKIGLGSLADFDTWQLMSLDGCMECGRCTDACPANAAGKELNPKQIVLDLRDLMRSTFKTKPEGGFESLSTDVISDASLWACTNCHACVRECPAQIRHVDIIDGIRQYRVAEGRLSGSGAVMLRQLGSRENPWGLPASQRSDWAAGLEVPTASANNAEEILFWTGCTGAFDPAGRKTVRAMAQLMDIAGVKYRILGPQERCTGDPARRTGDEFLFQQLAEANIATLSGIKATTIVTQCPHCLHTMKNEYPALGGKFEVMHHSQLIARLLEEKKLVPKNTGAAGSITYHDPCFLGRVNKIVDEPRRALEAATGGTISEVDRRESKTFCCGAGGGRMWMEDDPAQRPGLIRAKELLATKATTVAVGCPFCKVMLNDSLAQVAGDKAPALLDIAEVVLASLGEVSPAAQEVIE